jgi:membrane protein
VKRRDTIERARGFLREGLWANEPASRWIVARAVGLLQFAVLAAEGFVRDRLLLQASSLSYFTVISLIPVFAIVIGIAAAIGVDSGFADKIVAEIAAGAPDAQQGILDQIRDADFKALGGIGAAIVFVTTVFGISNVERAFNSIWGVQKPRSWGRRFPDYLAILVVVPLMAAALSVATGLKSEWLMQQLSQFETFELLYEIGLRQLPWVMLSLAFALMFWFLPNTSVRLTSALLGGAISGVLVLLAQDVYIRYSVGVARADALFGAFAQLPLLFLWIYIFWAIVLFGAELAFAHQNLASYRRELRGAGAAPAEREALALRMAIHIARAFHDGVAAPTVDALANGLSASTRSVRELLEPMEAANILSRCGGPSDEDAFQLGRPAEHIPVGDILSCIRGSREAIRADATDEVVDRLLSALDADVASGGGGRTLAELVAEMPASAEDSALETTAERVGFA